jgi:hypothetical protein
MVLATTVMNLSMVVYHRSMSSSLGDAYGELYALTGLVNVLGVLTLGVSTWLIKAFAHQAELHGEHAALLGFEHLARKALWPLMGLGLLLTALAPLVGLYLRLSHWGLWALVVSVFIGGCGLISLRALIQGVHRFESLAASLALEGVLRVVMAAAFVRAGLGSAGALLGSLSAQAGATLPAFLQFRHMRRHRPQQRQDDGPLPLPGRPGELWMDAGALALFSLLCFLDALVVKHLFDDARASLYSRAALVAKSFLYLASALNMVLLPVVASHRARSSDARSTLWRFMGLSALALLAGLAVVWAQTPWVIRLLCGSDPAFQALAPLVRGFSLAVAPLALLQLALYYHLALGSRRLLHALAVAVPAYAALLQWWAPDEGAIIVLLGGFSTALLLVALLKVPGRPTAASQNEL